MQVHIPHPCVTRTWLVLSTMWVQGPNSGLQTREQRRLLTEPSHCPHWLTFRQFFQLNGLLRRKIRSTTVNKHAC